MISKNLVAMPLARGEDEFLDAEALAADCAGLTTGRSNDFGRNG
jgi:hypothetical protein